MEKQSENVRAEEVFGRFCIPDAKENFLWRADTRRISALRIAGSGPWMSHFGPRDRYPADGCEPDREFWNNGLKFKKEMKECKKSDSNIDKYGNNIHNLQALKRKSRRIFLKS